MRLDFFWNGGGEIIKNRDGGIAFDGGRGACIVQPHVL